MSFCTNCGAELPDGVKFCTFCGASVEPIAQQYAPNPAYPTPNAPGAEFDPQDVQQNKVMAILAYFGILVLVPILTAKESKYARFHANQGLVLFICEAAYGVVYSVLSGIFSALHLSLITSLLGLVYIVFFVFAILGIVNASKGEAKKLPVIGEYQILK